MGKAISDLHIQEYRRRELPDGQFCATRFNAKVDAQQYDNINFTFVHINLDGSNFMASESGILGKNQSDIRGWFMEDVEVEITQIDDTFQLLTDSPSTSMGSSSTTSSVGYSFDVGAGTFGPTPTMNVGAGLSMGSSFSRSLSDIAIVNRSTLTRVLHRYRLASSRGGTYSSPIDLVDQSPGGVVHGTPLFEIPDIAVSNMPIITQTIVQGPPISKDFEFGCIIRAHLRKIEKTFKVFSVEVEPAGLTLTEVFVIRVPFSRFAKAA